MRRRINTTGEVNQFLVDAQLTPENELLEDFDVLAIDAFSGDAIPVHLITREALAVYRRHLKDDGVIAFHISNRFLSLAPIVANLAAEQNMQAVIVSDMKPAAPATASEWVLVTRNKALLSHPLIAEAAVQPPTIDGLGVWTDDSNNLFRILK